GTRGRPHTGAHTGAHTGTRTAARNRGPRDRLHAHAHAVTHAGTHTAPGNRAWWGSTRRSSAGNCIGSPSDLRTGSATGDSSAGGGAASRTTSRTTTRAASGAAHQFRIRPAGGWPHCLPESLQRGHQHRRVGAAAWLEAAGVGGAAIELVGDR